MIKSLLAFTQVWTSKISHITNKHKITYTVPECSFPEALVAYVFEKSICCTFGHFCPVFYNMYWTREFSTWGNWL
jgi:hypothetical protein